MSVALGINVTCTRKELQPVSETAFVFEGDSVRKFQRELVLLTDSQEADEATYALTQEDGVSLELQVSLSKGQLFLEMECAKDERVRYFAYRTAMVRPLLILDRNHVQRLEVQLCEKAGVRQDNHVVYGIRNAEGVPRIYVMCTDSHVYLGDLVHKRW